MFSAARPASSMAPARMLDRRAMAARRPALQTGILDLPVSLLSAAMHAVDPSNLMVCAC